jgi:molybdopterin biosynthesis enzyme
VADTNRPSLRATIEGLGYQVLDLGIGPDMLVFRLAVFGNSSNLLTAIHSLQTQKDLVQKGLNEADIVVTTGGTSMGEADLLKVIPNVSLVNEVCRMAYKHSVTAHYRTSFRRNRPFRSSCYEARQT